MPFVDFLMVVILQLSNPAAHSVSRSVEPAESNSEKVSVGTSQSYLEQFGEQLVINPNSLGVPCEPMPKCTDDL